MLTVSDGVARGERVDESGTVLEQLLEADGHEVFRRVVPDGGHSAKRQSV